MTCPTPSVPRSTGRTTKNVPVFNVSLALMRELSPDRPFRVVEITLTNDDIDSTERRTGTDRRAVDRVPVEHI